MFEDFLKRMTKGFGATMFLITLPVVMLVVGLLCYTILDMFGFGNYALRLSCGFAVIGGGIFAYNWNNFLNPKALRQDRSPD